MKKIIDYKIVEVKSRDNLREKVLSEIKLGWQPLGGYVAEYSPITGSFVGQTLVKYEE